MQADNERYIDFNCLYIQFSIFNFSIYCVHTPSGFIFVGFFFLIKFWAIIVISHRESNLHNMRRESFSLLSLLCRHNRQADKPKKPDSNANENERIIKKNFHFHHYVLMKVFEV